jgi:hypothetical protein
VVGERWYERAEGALGEEVATGMVQALEASFDVVGNEKELGGKRGKDVRDK